MKAAVIHEFGSVDVLEHEEIDTPKPKPNHALIKVLAAGVNRLDDYLRQGAITRDIPLPHILGGDAVGEVAELGERVTGLDIGERVVVVPGYPQDEKDKDIYPAITAPSFALPGMGVWGSYAQYMQVPASFLVKDDTGLEPEEVATLPMVLATSVRALKKVGQVKAGDKVLVQAGASGSGSMHIQVARALGAEVAATIRNEAKAGFVSELGADLVINTSTEDLVARVGEWTGGQGADVVIDNLGGEVLAKSIDAARPFGVIVAFGFTAGPQVSFDIRQLFFGQKQLRGSMASDKEDLEYGLDLVRQGKIRPTLDRSLSLSQASEAHRLISTNQVPGSLALLPWAE